LVGAHTYYLRAAKYILLLFAAAKLYFLLVNMVSFEDVLSFPEIWWNGIRLDLSILGYVMVFPLLLGLLALVFPRFSAIFSLVYWWLIWLFITIVVAVDPYFFNYWGQKTNLGFTQFLGKENAGLDSIETSTYVIALSFIVLAAYWFYRYGQHLLVHKVAHTWPSTLLLLVCSIGLIRGSIDKVPINVSSAYFSSNNLYNNTAVNAVWNFLATEVERDKHAALEFFEDDEEVIALLTDTIPKNDYADLVVVNDSTNIILIVLESFSAKAVGFLSGPTYGATPKLDELMSQGVSFKNAYASSFRSDKGLLAITTGIPSGARQTLTNFPAELAAVPNIFQLFKANYKTSFYYGGNLEFANIKVLFKDADKVKSQWSFNSINRNAWGVHDEVVFDEFANDFLAEQQPQFKMIFSLSSHEPFDVPNFNAKKEPYLNSIAYTDSCLGVMISKLKASPKWKNTLVIITADHGTIRPDNAPIYDAINFKIPLLMIGGAVHKPAIINEIVSQADIPATIAWFLGDTTSFAQHPIIKPSNRAFYSYHDGITMVSPNCTQYFDLGQKNYLFSACNPPIEKAYYQRANKSFFSR
jgi:phosphoglycerol transferase MdoB-like AlkP superfamily enzyme